MTASSVYIGDPEETALRYYRQNFGATTTASGDPPRAAGVLDVNVRLLDAWLEDADGERVENIEQGLPMASTLVVEARHDARAARSSTSTS